ncbi:crotonase/enoyl-CoA hydratase family protein [Streptomyces sp. NPDC002920]
MASPLLVERDGLVETWTLNLPDTRNPISGDDMVDALVAAADAANRDPVLRAVVLTGAGSAFSAGGNVADMADGTGLFGHPPHLQRTAYRDGIQRIPRALHACEVPVIAAVNGPAIGAGCDLALMCDLRVASTRAVFAESFVKLGIVPGDGGAYFLPRVIGHARAAEMALTGDRIDPAQALAWGMVSQVVEPEDLLPTAYRLAERVAANPPAAVRMTKKLLRQAEGRGLDDVLELSAALQAIAHTTADHHEAVAAFVGKREPRFTGS